MTYEIQFGLKTAAEDSYEHGCILDTGYNMMIDGLAFSGETQTDAVEKVCEYFGVSKDSILLNTCGEPGRINVQLMEDQYGMTASDSDIEQWKKGEKKLFLAEYSGHLRIIKTVAFDD